MLIEKKIRLAELSQNFNNSNDSEATSMQNYPSVNHGPRLPMFSETKDELDSYLQRFERYAVNERWPCPRDSYALNLASLLTGKALNVYSRLPLALANDYDILKKALLQQYQLTVDDYRKKFYYTKQNADENATQYLSRLEHFLNSWIQLSEISETFESLKEFLLQDQFLNSCPKELATFIREHSPSNLETMMDLANKFNLAHNAPSHEKERKGKHSPHQGGYHMSPNHPHHVRSEKSSSRLPFSSIRCYLCKQLGHKANDCRAQQSRSPSFNRGPNGFRKPFAGNAGIILPSHECSLSKDSARLLCGCNVPIVKQA